MNYSSLVSLQGCCFLLCLKNGVEYYPSKVKQAKQFKDYLGGIES